MGKYHLRKELMKCGSNHIWSYTRNHATLAFANKMIHANGSKTEKMLWETVSGIVCIRVIRSIRRTTNAQRWPVWRPFSWWLRPAAAGAPPPVWASPSAARCAEGIMRESLIDYMLWALINEGSISYFPAWSQLAWPLSSHLLVHAARGEVVSVLVEGRGGDRASVTLQGVHGTPFDQVQQLGEWKRRRWDLRGRQNCISLDNIHWMVN